MMIQEEMEDVCKDYKFGASLTQGEMAKLQKKDRSRSKYQEYEAATGHVGIFGVFGVGKSSVGNTLISFCNKKRILNRFNIATTDTVSKTEQWLTVDCTAHFIISDVRGAVDTSKKVQDVISRLYRGRLVNGAKVEWKENDVIDWAFSATYSPSQVHCPIIVSTIRSDSLEIFSSSEMKQFIELFRLLSKGRDPLIVFTGRDILVNTSVEDYTLKLTKMLNVNEDNIFLIQCYTNTTMYNKLQQDKDNQETIQRLVDACFAEIDYMLYRQAMGLFYKLNVYYSFLGFSFIFVSLKPWEKPWNKSKMISIKIPSLPSTRRVTSQTYTTNINVGVRTASLTIKETTKVYLPRPRTNKFKEKRL